MGSTYRFLDCKFLAALAEHGESTGRLHITAPSQSTPKAKIITSFNEVTLISSFCWEYTKMAGNGMLSSMGPSKTFAVMPCPSQGTARQTSRRERSGSGFDVWLSGIRIPGFQGSRQFCVQHAGGWCKECLVRCCRPALLETL